MSSNYRRVSEALAQGADPAMLCMTCPWDRFCIEPPSMTTEEVKRQIDEASAKDKTLAREAELKGEKPAMPVGSLLTAITLGGRDTSAGVCPVLAMRLRTPDGRTIVDSLKSSMQGFGGDDQ